ncbi:hypothetical protein [Flagellimonas algicola]|uniref:Uncharacterized protein n=1 Tax=Flagellimonas algicola TaxID=2583815 RepID=A0ABY2WKJ3_9FLAO|nr:hypothetical protein [Allomuricauda algicola]TMU55170.1 hypothetical protein FGG15_13385 [Allomuricauda algicola]
MRNGEDDQRCPKCNSPMTSNDTRHVSKLTPAQVELLQYVDALDGPNRVKALKWVHDVVVYDSNEPLYCEEKEALYQVKVLWQLIEETFKK